MAKALSKGSRITGAPREALGTQFKKRYAAGDSIRTIAEDAGRSYGFVHGLLKGSDAPLRGRGGATRGATKATPDVATSRAATKKSSTANKATVAAAAKKATTKAAPAAKSTPSKSATAKKSAAKKG